MIDFSDFRLLMLRCKCFTQLLNEMLKYSTIQSIVMGSCPDTLHLLGRDDSHRVKAERSDRTSGLQVAQADRSLHRRTRGLRVSRLFIPRDPKQPPLELDTANPLPIGYALYRPGRLQGAGGPVTASSEPIYCTAADRQASRACPSSIVLYGHRRDTRMFAI